MKLRFLEPPRETKIGSRNREVRNIGSKIAVKQVQEKQLLVRVIGVFEKWRVREIRVPLYINRITLEFALRLPIYMLFSFGLYMLHVKVWLQAQWRASLLPRMGC